MRGGFLHNRILLDPLIRHFEAIGAVVHQEYPVDVRKSPRCVDLFVTLDGHRVVVEAELTARRVEADVRKAIDVGATWLLVVMPTVRGAKSIRVRVEEALDRPLTPRIDILPVGQAIQRVRDCFPMPFNPIHPRKTNHKGAAVSRDPLVGGRG